MTAAVLLGLGLLAAVALLALCEPIPPDEYPLSKHGDDDDGW